jgi:hypothetical protein
MRRAFALVILGALILLGILHEPAESKLRPPPPTPLRYTDVHAIFAKHCAACHDSRIGTNPGAQAVFEMTSYPFSTRRPTTLISDLRHMFQVRKALSAEEKARGLSWLSAGALDADGKPPRWR